MKKAKQASPKTLKEQWDGYGVLITRKDGTQFIAIGKAGSFFARYHHEAREFAKQLRDHISARCRVVRMNAIFEVITPLSKKGK